MSAPNEDDIEEEYDEDFEDEEETKKEESKKEAAPAAPPAAPKAAAGGSAGSTYTFVLFEGEDEKGEIKLATNAKWGDFLSAAKAKMGYEVGSIKYDDDFGEHKEQDIVCKTADDWEDVMAMMEEDAKFIKGELSVEVMKKAGGAAAAAPAAAGAKSEASSVDKAPSLLGDAKGATYTFVLFEGEDEKGEIKLATNAKWGDFLSAAKAKMGYEVGSIKYDDDFGEHKEQDIVCKTADDWEDVMTMMEEDAEFIKGELSVEVTKAGGAAAAPAAANAKISLKCFVGDDVKLTISVTPSTPWSEVSSKISGAGGYTSFEYDGPTGAAVICKDDKGWQACLQVAAKEKDMTLEVELIKPDAAKPASHAPAASAASTSAVTGASSAPPPPSKPTMSTDTLEALAKGRTAIIEECIKQDLSATGALPASDMARCISTSVASIDLATAESVIADISPGSDPIDYRLFARRFRDLTTAEAAIIDRLQDARLQSARVACVGKSEAFTAVFASAEGPVNARQAEALLKGKGAGLMSAGDAAALVSAGAGQDGDFRSLPADLQAIDICSLSTRCVKEAAMSQLIAHIEEVEGACEGADKANKGTLPLSSFLTALKQGKADIPPSMVFPEMLCEAGAYRDGLVDYGTFLNHCAVAHDSEVLYMRRGRSEEAQALRRIMLTHKKAIAERLGAESTPEKLIEVLTGATEPWRMKEQEAQSISGDLSAGAANAEDIALQVQKLQFSDFDGELEAQCDAIFANYDALVELCKEADAENSGSLSFGSFESAASAASLPAVALEATKNCLLREGHSRVPYALLFGSRLRVLTARDLEILDAWRSPKEQASRLVAFNASETIARSLGTGSTLVDEGKVRSELEANGVSDASVVLKALPRGEGGQISSEAVLGLRPRNVIKDSDPELMRTAITFRRGIMAHCADFDKGSTGAVSPADWAAALHMRALPWAAQESLGALAQRSADGKTVLYRKTLSALTLATPHEIQVVSLATDDAVQSARDAISAAGGVPGLSFAKGEHDAMVSALVSGGVKGPEGGIVKAVRALVASKAGEAGSLRSEDLVDVKPHYVNPVGSNLLSKKAGKRKEAADVGGVKAGSGLTKGQRIWRDKILRPRKPGVMEILAMMRGMPNSVSLSPLRAEVNSGNNVPSSSATRAEDPARIVMPRTVKGENVIMAQLQVIKAEGVPGPDEDSYEVIERRCRVCMVNVESKRFVGGVHVVPLSRKNAGKVEWVFSKKEAINPFSLRALTGAKTQLYMELSAICRKKGTKTTGALALSKGDIKELSCGHACMPLDEALKAGKNKMSVQLFGGVPWSKNSIRKEDVKKGKGFFAGLMKKPESKIHIEVTMDAAPAGSALPPNLVCSAVCLEALQQYCTSLSDFAEASKTKPFERLAASDVVLATFPLIMDDTALMTHFANAWSAKSKKLGKKATKQQLNEAFRETVMQFYPLVRMEATKMPKDTDTGDERVIEARSKVMTSFLKKKKTEEACMGISDEFRYAPFRVEELMV